MGEPIRVAVVALDPLLEAGVTTALHGCPDVEVARVGEVSVVVVDVVGADVLDLVRSIRGGDHRPEVVLVATDLAPAAARHVIGAGARGLLRRRDATAARLARAVLVVASGDCVLPPDLLTYRGVEPARAQWTGPGLSDRERAVLALVAEGHETGEIARELSYSTRTVAGIVHDITARFRLRNRAHAVAYALRTGLL
ncbi:LuxR C-terminal-related transcriptional regulator [Actinokineospora sp. HUAS TT18]|uniref:LuxR C-terminal-related transcriptional regulator n=1 Tax=Actinokineospora sp. HUAS TT18 TaxID=3447451 RepID=UPI003F51E2A4